MGGMGGGTPAMGGGTSGSLGGGYFAVPPERASTPATTTGSAGGNAASLCLGVGMAAPAYSAVQAGERDVRPLIDLITNTIATKTWADNGGTGTIDHYDGVLVISQIQEVHEQIEQFLAGLRARRQAQPTLSVELHWLWLDAKQRDHLLAGQAKPSEGRIPLAVDPERLRQMAHEVPGLYGQVACRSGIETAIAAGDWRTIIQGAVPVVDNSVGYQPLICVPHVGLAAQVRPTFIPGTETAALDITSIITRWDLSRKPALSARRGRRASSLSRNRQRRLKPSCPSRKSKRRKAGRRPALSICR